MAKKSGSKNKKEPDSKGAYRSTKRDQYTVVLEDIRSQFRVFGEGLSSVSDTLDKHTEILDEHTKILDEHTKILDEHAKILDEHTKQSQQFQIEFEFVKEQLSLIRHNQVTRDEFHLLETRVARLEHAKRQ